MSSGRGSHFCAACLFCSVQQSVGVFSATHVSVWKTIRFNKGSPVCGIIYLLTEIHLIITDRYKYISTIPLRSFVRRYAVVKNYITQSVS